MIIGYVMSIPKSIDFCTHRHMGRMFQLMGNSGESFRVYLSGRTKEVCEEEDILLVLKNLVSNIVERRRGKFETERYWYEIVSVYDDFVQKPFISG